MNSRFAFSLAARMTFNNESSPRPRARVSTAPYSNESIPDARVVSRLFAPARASRPCARPRRVVRSRARASLSRVASRVASTPSRVPRNTAPTHRERRRRRHRARVVRRRVGRRARRSFRASRRASGRRRVDRPRRRRASKSAVPVPGTRRADARVRSRRAFFERLWNFGIFAEAARRGATATATATRRTDAMVKQPTMAVSFER